MEDMLCFMVPEQVVEITFALISLQSVNILVNCTEPTGLCNYSGCTWCTKNAPFIHNTYNNSDCLHKNTTDILYITIKIMKGKTFLMAVTYCTSH